MPLFCDIVNSPHIRFSTCHRFDAFLNRESFRSQRVTAKSTIVAAILSNSLLTTTIICTLRRRSLPLWSFELLAHRSTSYSHRARVFVEMRRSRTKGLETLLVVMERIKGNGPRPRHRKLIRPPPKRFPLHDQLFVNT